tara:strand:- start:1470 stop:1706 length:237 start_codon:yes stop_codon:yes gene_type:complete
MYFLEITIVIFILYYSSKIMGNCFKLPKEDKKVYNNYYEQTIQKIKLNKEIVSFKNNIEMIQKNKKNIIDEDSYIILN